MSRVSVFQRFSQPENHATNNTLLILRYFYQSSPFKIQRVLTSLLETDLSIGLAFEQQIRGDASVPDALITQEPLRIFVETKRGGVIDADQIRRHFKSIAHEQRPTARDILISLTKEQIADTVRKSLAAEAASQEIIFTAVTFSQVVEALRTQCADFERELHDIVDDYDSYLGEEGLLEERNQWLVVVPCGTSLAENVRFGLYFEPEGRPSKLNYRFIGLYNKKTVAYVGTIEAIAIPSFGGEEPSFVEETGRLRNKDRKRIVEAIKAASYYNDLKENPHRFYLVDHFVQTDARKTSPGGLPSLRYLDLSKTHCGLQAPQRIHYRGIGDRPEGDKLGMNRTPSTFH
jgi:hypothetical protein